MNIGQAVAKRINDLLILHNKTQYRLAKEITISHNTMTNIMHAKNKTPNLITIFLISRAFGINIDEFFSDPIFKNTNLEID